MCWEEAEYTADTFQVLIESSGAMFIIRYMILVRLVAGRQVHNLGFNGRDSNRKISATVGLPINLSQRHCIAVIYVEINSSGRCSGCSVPINPARKLRGADYGSWLVDHYEGTIIIPFYSAGLCFSTLFFLYFLTQWILQQFIWLLFKPLCNLIASYNL